MSHGQNARCSVEQACSPLRGDPLGERLTSQFREDLAHAAAFPPCALLHRQKDVVIEVHGGAHASDALHRSANPWLSSSLSPGPPP
ncbi:hypothetical protein GCM10023320_75540 [Pseudonocardia adelaidensis]|uniref:Uncharacterized protein n=1 Tax=Pseudonocardia adelaidensis TaxID=648754 RepID=A0ABP9P2V9_9PSEU